MKTTLLSARLNAFLTGLVDASIREEKPSIGVRAGKQLPKSRVSRSQRKEFIYYMQVIDAETKEVVGHLADISTGGFKLDTREPIPVNKNVRFLMNLPGEISSKPHMVFGARSKWGRADPLDRCAYCVGYQLTQIYPEDLEIINRMMERYGRDGEKKNIDLQRSYRW